MPFDNPYGWANFAAGVVSLAGLAYLLYAEAFVVHYARFFRVIAVGLAIFAVTGLLVGAFAPALIHAVHALAALVVAVGLYGLVAEELDDEESFEAAFGP